MELNLYAPSASGGVINISERVFAEKFNEPLIHQAVTAYMAGGRAGTRAQKSRGQVSGGRKKPWRQKGTGRARAGTIRSPLWRGGGVVFAAVPADYTQKLNKKMYQGALRSILSELVRQERLLVVEQLKIDAPKTKLLLAQLQGFKLSEVLIIVDEIEANLALAARNLYRVQICESGTVNPVDLIKFEKVLMTVPALRVLEERLA